MPTAETPSSAGDMPVSSRVGATATTRVRSRRGMRWRKTLIAAAAVFVMFCTMSGRLFIWPPEGMPPRVEAVVMLDGPGGTSLNVAVRLATQHRALFLVVSRGTVASHDPCPRPVPGVTLICFNPMPATTQGEVEYVGRLAKKYHWHSVALVAITPQVSRAKLRMERCFPGQVYVVTAPIRPSTWPYQIAYEWAALLKALVVQGSC